MRLSRSPSRSRSRSFTASPVPHHRSQSRSRSASLADRRRVRSASRSLSRSPRYKRNSRHGSHKKGYRRGGGFAGAIRDNPDPSRVIGIFNLSKYTTERQLTDAFEKYGDIEKIDLIYDRPTGQSRGFGFIYYANVEAARRAKEEMSGAELDGHKLRVDYSVTKRAHSPTPGVYMGMRTGGHPAERERGGRYNGGYGGRYNGRSSRYHSPPRFRGSPPLTGRFRHSPSRSPIRRGPDRPSHHRTPTRSPRRYFSRSRSGSPLGNY